MLKKNTYVEYYKLQMCIKYCMNKNSIKIYYKNIISINYSIIYNDQIN